MEWLLGVALSVCATTLAAWVAADLRRRVRAATPADDERRRRTLLGVALALLLLAAGGGAAIAWADAVERTYRIFWLVFGPAGLAVIAVALGLRAIAMRRPAAGSSLVAPILLFVAAFGIACCYGALLGGGL